MSDRKEIPKKKLLKGFVKLTAPLYLIVGILVGNMYLPYNNGFMVFLHLWLLVLDFNLIALYYIYLSKYDLQSTITKRRLSAIKSVKLVTAIAHIFTALGIFGGGLVLASYFIFQRAVTSGLTKVSTSMTSQEAVLTLLLLISLPIPAYIVKKETEKAIRLGMKNVTSA